MPHPPSAKIAIFIDGSNLYAAARNLDIEIDYKRLLGLFGERGQVLRAFYYTALADDQDYSPIRPLVDWLDYNGFTMVTKPAKEFTDSSGRKKIKGNMDVEIAVDAMEMAAHVNEVILFSGDGDFRRLIESLQRQGVRVTVVSTIKSRPPMIADELRRQADEFLDLDAITNKIGRKANNTRQHDDHHNDAYDDDDYEDMANEFDDELDDDEDFAETA